MIFVGLSMKKTLTNSFQMYKNHIFAIFPSFTTLLPSAHWNTQMYTIILHRFYSQQPCSKLNFDRIWYPKCPKHIMMDLINSY